jgi:tRNA-2-methylthio-N6-dimethylallyladenosine synthase
MDAQVGSIVDVLFEELKSDGKVAGRSDEGRLIMVEGSEELLGKTLKAKVISANITVLHAKLLDK